MPRVSAAAGTGFERGSGRPTKGVPGAGKQYALLRLRLTNRAVRAAGATVHRGRYSVSCNRSVDFEAGPIEATSRFPRRQNQSALECVRPDGGRRRSRGWLRDNRAENGPLRNVPPVLRSRTEAGARENAGYNHRPVGGHIAARV